MPTEIIWGILEYLEIEEILRAREVCSEWKQIIEDETFCKRAFNTFFVIIPQDKSAYRSSLHMLQSKAEIWKKSVRMMDFQWPFLHCSRKGIRAAILHARNQQIAKINDDDNNLNVNNNNNCNNKNKIRIMRYENRGNNGNSNNNNNCNNSNNGVIKMSGGNKRNKKNGNEMEMMIRMKKFEFDQKVWKIAIDKQNIEAMDIILHLQTTKEDEQRIINSVHFGYNALHNALYTNNERIAKFLIERGADIERREPKFKQTPLMIAVQKSDVPIVEMLISKGADLFAIDGDRFSVLNLAVQFCRFPLVADLIRRLVEQKEKMEVDESSSP